MTYDPETFWPERYREHGDLYVAKGARPASYERQIELIRPHLETLPVGRTLDFGCGPGRFRPVLEDAGHEWEGYDLIEGLGTVDELKTGRYTAALAIYVLQHIPDAKTYRRTVKRLHRTLKKGGTLLVVDHNERDDMAAHMHPRGPGYVAETFADHEIEDLDADHWVGRFVK